MFNYQLKTELIYVLIFFTGISDQIHFGHVVPNNTKDFVKPMKSHYYKKSLPK